MKDMGIVQGATEQAQKLIVGVGTVYVHTNIVPALDTEGKPIEGLFNYSEIQYDKDEYIHLMSQRADFFEDCIAEMATKIY